MRQFAGIPPVYRDERQLKHADLTERLIGTFFSVYNELGHGFLKSVYEEAFSIALAERAVFFERQMAVPVWYHGRRVGDFRVDLLVERKVILELKTGRDIELAWEKQLLNYLRATEIEVGLLFNFGPSAQFRRLVFANERKNPRNPRSSAEGKLAAVEMNPAGEDIDPASSK